MTAAAVAPAAGSNPLANARHERFCQEYLVDRNGSAAYQRAGYEASGNAAETNAARLLRNAQVAGRVAFLEMQRLERVGMTADDVLRELQVLGMSDIRHYVFTDGPEGIALAPDAPDIAMRAVSSVKRKRRLIQREDAPDEIVEEVEYKLWNKPQALRMAGEHLRLFKAEEEDEKPVGLALSDVPDIELLAVLAKRFARHQAIEARHALLHAGSAK